MNLQQQKEHVKNIFLAIKEHNEKIFQLYDLGVDLINLENKYESLLIRSIASFFKEEALAKEYIEWWLYEDVPKIIYYEDNTSVDIENIDNFINYLYQNYN